MENPVLGSILENLKQIKLITEQTISPFRNDRTNTSNAREYTVNEFIRRYLPSDFHIREQSPIYSIDAYSKNIDCVVLAPNHPLLTTPFREIALAEGVYAAVEVKPDISTLSDESELMRGLDQLASVKRLNRISENISVAGLLNTKPIPGHFHKIPTILFSFKSADITRSIQFIISKIKEGKLQPESIPDLIVTLDNGLVFYAQDIEANVLNPSIWTHFKTSAKSKEAFVHFQTTSQEQTLALFLQIFFSFFPPTLLTHKFFIKDYLEKAISVQHLGFIPLEWDYEAMDNLSAKNLYEAMKDTALGKTMTEELVREMIRQARAGTLKLGNDPRKKQDD